MYPGGGHLCGTGLSEVSWFFTLPRSGIEDFREFPSSQIPGKSFGFLPSLSSMPPASPLKGGKAGVRQSFDLFRLLRRLLRIKGETVFWKWGIWATGC